MLILSPLGSAFGGTEFFEDWFWTDGFDFFVEFWGIEPWDGTFSTGLFEWLDAGFSAGTDLFEGLFFFRDSIVC